MESGRGCMGRQYCMVALNDAMEWCYGEETWDGDHGEWYGKVIWEGGME